MKKILTLLSAFVLCGATYADDYSLFYDTTQGTQTEAASVADMQKIVFEDGNMVIVKKDGTRVTVAMSLVKRLYFNTVGATAIAKVADNDVLNLQSAEVYDLSGRRLVVTDVRQLSKGVYIVDGKKVNIQ